MDGDWQSPQCVIPCDKLNSPLLWGTYGDTVVCGWQQGNNCFVDMTCTSCDCQPSLTQYQRRLTTHIVTMCVVRVSSPRKYKFSKISWKMNEIPPSSWICTYIMYCAAYTAVLYVCTLFADCTLYILYTSHRPSFRGDFHAYNKYNPRLIS